MDSSSKKCPYCSKVNGSNILKCECGYEFISQEAKINYTHYSRTIDYSITNIIIFILYIIGVLGIVAGIMSFFIIKTEWAFGVQIIIGSIMMIGLAEFLTIMIRIEENTRK
jgi:hypothetical protein